MPLWRFSSSDIEGCAVLLSRATKSVAWLTSGLIKKMPLAGGCAGGESLFPSRGGRVHVLPPPSWFESVGRGGGGKGFLVAPFREGP